MEIYVKELKDYREIEDNVAKGLEWDELLLELEKVETYAVEDEGTLETVETVADFREIEAIFERKAKEQKKRLDFIESGYRKAIADSVDACLVGYGVESHRGEHQHDYAYLASRANTTSERKFTDWLDDVKKLYVDLETLAAQAHEIVLDTVQDMAQDLGL